MLWVIVPMLNTIAHQNDYTHKAVPVFNGHCFEIKIINKEKLLEK